MRVLVKTPVTGYFFFTGLGFLCYTELTEYCFVKKKGGTVMPLVPCKCTNCGANLQVDNTKDAAICEFCGSAFIVEKAINNYNVTNHITAGVVNYYGGNQGDFVIRGECWRSIPARRLTL